MTKLTEVLNVAHAMVDDIRKHAEGLDAELLLEAMMLSDDDFGEPMDGETFIATLKSEGFF
jgi:hypothetical protein